MNFTHIPPKDLHTVWPKLRTGLERLCAERKTPWIPEDMYTMLRVGRAHLHAGIEDEVRGYFIVEQVEEPFSHEQYLNVWVLFAVQQGDADVLKFKDAAIAEFDRLALALGVKRIKIHGREGWKKVLQDSFNVVHVVYERVLP